MAAVHLTCWLAGASVLLLDLRLLLVFGMLALLRGASLPAWVEAPGVASASSFFKSSKTARELDCHSAGDTASSAASSVCGWSGRHKPLIRPTTTICGTGATSRCGFRGGLSRHLDLDGVLRFFLYVSYSVAEVAGVEAACWLRWRGWDVGGDSWDDRIGPDFWATSKALSNIEDLPHSGTEGTITAR